MATPHRRWRYAAIGVAALTAASVLAIAGAEVTGWRFLRQPLADALGESSGVPVAIDGAFALHLLPRPDLRAEHLRVGARAGLGVDHFVVADGLHVRMRWPQLWAAARGDQLVLRSLTADTLDANLVRLADGRTSWQLGHAGHGAAPPPPPHVERLHVRHGVLHVADAPGQTQATVTLDGDAPGRGIDATAVGSYRALPLELHARVEHAVALLQDAGDDAGGDGASRDDARVTLQGRVGATRLQFDGTAAELRGARRFEGDLQVHGPSLAAVGDPLGITLPRTPAFELEGRLAHDGGQWHLLARRFTVGQSRLAGDFGFDTRASPARLSGRLGGTRLLFADLGPAVGTAGEGAPAARKAVAGARVFPDRRFDIPSLRAMQADVAVAIDELDFGSDAVAPLRGLRTQLRLADGVLHLEGLQAEVTGGRIAGTTSLDGRGDPARWAADLDFRGLDLAGWLRGVRKPAAAASAPAATQTRALRQQRQAAHAGGAQPAQAYLTGELTGALHLRGQGRSTAQILASLDGRITAALRDGTVSHLAMEAAGLDPAQALGVAVRGDRPLPLRCAIVELALQNGIATAQRAVADNTDSSVRVSGRIDLRNETLALRAVVRPKDVSPLSLRAPLVVTGTIAHPQVGIETQRLAGRVLAAAALGAIAGPAALLPFVDLGAREQGDVCATGGTSAAAASAPASAASSPAAR